MPLDLPERPRRNRRSAKLRDMVRETRLHASDFVWPLFFHDLAEDVPIESMPGISRLGEKSLLGACEQALKLGIPSVALFPCLDASLKDAEGSRATDEENLLFRVLRKVKTRFPELVVVTDVALDPFTSHGHDGLLSACESTVDNDRTVAALCRLAVLEARFGADVVAPSDMMDGRVGAIRRALDAEGFTDTGILSYAAKYASAFYGPFRDAVGSKIGRDAISKSTYQMDPANCREALREVRLDAAEGADMVMVKPAGPYLDVIRMVKEASDIPVAAYQVSGEYAMIHAAARQGWLDYERARDESLIAIKRAGADVILSYFAPEVAAR